VASQLLLREALEYRASPRIDTICSGNGGGGGSSGCGGGGGGGGGGGSGSGGGSDCGGVARR